MNRPIHLVLHVSRRHRAAPIFHGPGAVRENFGRQHRQLHRHRELDQRNEFDFTDRCKGPSIAGVSITGGCCEKSGQSRLPLMMNRKPKSYHMAAR